jgi:hypothetical protein
MAWSFNAFNILGDFKAARKVEAEKIIFLALPTDQLEVTGTDIQFQDRGRTKIVHAPACTYSVVVLPHPSEKKLMLKDTLVELNKLFVDAEVIINGTNTQRFVLSNIEGRKYDVQMNETVELII